MTQDEITRMAQEAGFVGFDGKNKTLEKFAALVAAHEREECAKLAAKTVCDVHLPTGIKIYGSRAAAAIRARSKT